MKTGVVNELWIAALFKKFQALYGYKWSKAIEGIEQEAVTVWTEKLSGLTGEQITIGLDKLDDWPPSAPEFLKLCLNRQKNEHGLNYTPEIYRANVPIFTAKKFRQDFLEDKKAADKRLTNDQ